MRCRSMLAVLFVLSALPGCTAPGSTGPKRAQRSNEGPRPPALKVTDSAPMFKLASLDGKETVDLRSFKGDRPCLLFFGSYT